MSATPERLPADAPASPANDPLDTWFSPGRFAVILAALIVCFFPEAIAGRSFVFRDFGIFTYPVTYYQRESFWHGEVPLWNPLNNCGIPFLAQWNTGVLYPLSLIFLLLPLPGGLSAFFLAHLLLAGLGMYFLARRWTGSCLAGAIAGIAFTFNGLTLNCLMWTSNLAALAWMPWVILLVSRAWRGNRQSVIVAALAGAFQMLAGAPEPIIFTWAILAVLWVGQLTCDRQFRFQAWWRMPVIVLLVSLLCAAQLLPFLDLIAHSDRSTSTHETGWPIPLWGWANLLVPLFHCYRSPGGVFFQPGQDWSSSYYPGIGPLALGLLAALVVRQRRVWLLVAVSLFGFIAAQGENTPLYGLMLKLCPQLAFMRYPIKFALLSTFALPLLAAYGAAWLQTALSARPNRAIGTVSVLGAALALLVGMILWYAHARPFPTDQWPATLANGLERILFLGLILGTFILGQRMQRSKVKIMVAVAILILAWLDVFTHAPRQNPTVAATAFQPGLLPQELNIQPRLGEARLCLTEPTRNRVYNWMLPDTDKDYLGRRLILLEDCNLLDGLPVTHGFFSLYLKDEGKILDGLFLTQTAHLPEGLADFLGVSYFSDPTNFPHWKQRSTALPYCTIGPKPVFVTTEEIPALLFQPEFNPRTMVYLPMGLKSSVGVTNQSPGHAKLLRFTAQTIEYQVEAAAPALAVISQSYYHPWHAYLDEGSVPLWKANHCFQSVQVPAGHHTLKLVYEDRSFHVGLAISLATLIGCLAGLRRRGFLRL